MEPFEEYEETGVLFGFHKNHYMKTEESYRANMAHTQGSPPMTAASSIMVSTFRPPVFNEAGVLVMEPVAVEEWGGEDYDDDEHWESVAQEKVAFEQLLKTDSLTEAKIHYGIQPDEDLDIWATQRSTLIDQLYADDKVRRYVTLIYQAFHRKQECFMRSSCMSVCLSVRLFSR